LVLLGKSGPGHAGAELMDTVIFSSVSEKGSVAVSIPRDLWYQPWQTKVNSLYYYGKEKGDGLGKTKEILGEILGEKIDHALVVDFQVFKDLVDLVGGVNVEVERTFDDFFYPLPGKEDDLCGGDLKFACRYEHIRFEAGIQHLDGEQALKFVRSRYAEGEEGTDSARSYRQQKVILALKKKITSPNVLLSLPKIFALKEIFEKRFEGDFTRKDLLDLAKIFIKPQARQLENFVLDGWEDNQGLLVHPKKHPSGQWVLLPKDPSWNQVHDFIDCLISQANKSGCSPEKKQASPAF